MLTCRCAGARFGKLGPNLVGVPQIGQVSVNWPSPPNCQPKKKLGQVFVQEAFCTTKTVQSKCSRTIPCQRSDFYLLARIRNEDVGQVVFSGPLFLWAIVVERQKFGNVQGDLGKNLAGWQGFWLLAKLIVFKTCGNLAKTWPAGQVFSRGVWQSFGQTSPKPWPFGQVSGESYRGLNSYQYYGPYSL